MTFYVYRPVEKIFLSNDEKTWTPSLFDAAAFAYRDIAEIIAERELGQGHDAYVLDDGFEE